MTRKTRNWLLAIFILAFPFALFSIFFFSRLADIPPAPPSFPNPNGYTDLVKAGGMVSPDASIVSETNLAQLREIVSTNVAALALARAGLSNQCRVPVQYTASFGSNHVVDLAPLKFLARAFIAEGRLAEMEDRPADAAKSYLDTVHLGNETARGGLLIDQLVGIAIRVMGTDRLQKLLPHLDAVTCRETAASLETLDSQKQSWEEVLQQESAWSQATSHGLRSDYVRWKTHKPMRPVVASTKRKLDAQEQGMQQLMIALATRAYRLEKGKPPASIADLVPDYLKAVPQVPVVDANQVPPSH